jgi:hypothetical protein
VWIERENKVRPRTNRFLRSSRFRDLDRIERAAGGDRRVDFRQSSLRAASTSLQRDMVHRRLRSTCKANQQRIQMVENVWAEDIFSIFVFFSWLGNFGWVHRNVICALTSPVATAQKSNFFQAVGVKSGQNPGSSDHVCHTMTWIFTESKATSSRRFQVGSPLISGTINQRQLVPQLAGFHVIILAKLLEKDCTAVR